MVYTTYTLEPNEVLKCAVLSFYPSCADGSPKAVVECLHQGLIPVVSREAGIDTGDYGVTLENCSVDEITRVITDLSRKSPDWCADRSRRAREAALNKFSETAFHENMKKNIEEAIIVHKRKDS